MDAFRSPRGPERSGEEPLVAAPVGSVLPLRVRPLSPMFNGAQGGAWLGFKSA